MNPKLYTFLTEQRWTIFGLLLSLAILIGVSTTFLADAIYFNDPKHKNVQLKAWMTPNYVTLSYDIPRPVVLQALGIEQGKKFPKRMDRLAKSLGMTLDELTAKIRLSQTNYLENTND